MNNNSSKRICTAARKLNRAVKEYKGCMTMVGTTPLIVFIWGVDFFVTYYHSKWFCERNGWFVCNTKEVNRNLKLIHR